jgi:hypothetical protein
MLNDTLIKSLKSGDKPQKHFDGGGLFLYIPVTGSKLWRITDSRTAASRLGGESDDSFGRTAGIRAINS